MEFISTGYMQIDQCVFHNTLDPQPSLLRQYTAGTEQIPVELHKVCQKDAVIRSFHALSEFRLCAMCIFLDGHIQMASECCFCFSH